MRKLSKQVRILILELIIISIILLPIMVISLYALPAVDDFANSSRIRTVLAQEHFYIKAALSEVWNYYRNISGYFFGVFLNFFLSPLLRGGIIALRGTVFAINLFFYISLYFFVDALLKFFFDGINRIKSLFVYIIVLIAFTNNYNNIETWTWYCVLIGYVFIVACIFWGIIFFLKALQNDKLSYIIAASLMGFLASGSSLNVTALNCGLYLIIGIIGFTINKKKKISIICFGSALTGGIINAAAPGNFIRHEVITTSYDIISCLKDAAEIGISRIEMLSVYSPFVLLCVIFFIFSLKNINNSKKIWTVNPFIILIMVFAGVMIVNFPVRLGYDMATLPYRCIWIEDCTIYIGMFGWSAYLAGWLKGRFKEFEICKELWLCIIMNFIFFICSLGSVRNLESYPTYQMARQLFNGKIAEYAEFWEEVLKEIEMSEDKDVVIHREYIANNEFITPPGLGDDKSDWTNNIIAAYYGKNSVYITIE